MLDGQHKFLATEKLVRRLAEAGRPAPEWARTVRCRRVKPDAPFDFRQRIAGREQARSASMGMSMEATVKLLVKQFNQVMTWWVEGVGGGWRESARDER